MSDLISRKAAIEALKKAYWDKDIQSAKDDPCIVDAMTDWAIRQIKALPSAQPDVPDTNVGKMECEDAVNRETILKFFDGWMSALDENCHNQSVSDLKIIKRDFANLPPVTPKQRIGKWIDLGDCEQCSKCKGTHLKEIQTVYGKATWVRSNFCGNCGAKMGGHDETD